MEQFSFKAKKPDGSLLSGKIKAKNKGQVIQLLRSKNLEPVYVEVNRSLFQLGSGSGGGLASKHLVLFTRQMAFLINAGVPLVQSLRIVKEISQHAGLKMVITDLINSVEGGSAFANALASKPGIFSSMYVSMISAGEVGGSLDVMLTRLAEYIEESEKLKSKVKKAMLYPSFVLITGIGVIVAIMVMVIPKFIDIFESSKVDLPLSTKILVGASNAFRHHFILIGLFGFFIPFAFIMYLRSPAGRQLKDQLLMLLPVIGPLILKNSLARFSKTLACLLSGGVSVSEALNTSALTSNNFFVERALQNVKEKVIKGKPVAQSLRKERVIPVLVSNMVAIGEETGNVDATLEKVAEFYEEQVRTTTSAISDLIQPFLIVFLGGLIGFIVISIYVPIFKMPGIIAGGG